MCGISGIIRWKSVNNVNLDISGMTGALAHRGPDGEGFFIRENIALGHRRLAIIDLETGKQPMSNQAESLWITYNGEIYNYRELKTILQKKNHCFQTNSDTEVIIKSYEEWGDKCVEYLRGMFAFAIVDYTKSRIFIARDHLGIKPLYYAITPNFFAFASELQSFGQIAGFEPEIDIQSIDTFLRLQYIPAPKTIFKQIKKLLPAHFLSISFDNKISDPEEYWQLKFIPDNNKSEQDWLNEAEYMIKESVKAHLVSDVPFGVFLSGGIDSSLIVSYMSQILDKPVKTFSIGFDEEQYNELNYAEVVAKKWNTEHFTEIVKPDALAILPQLVKHYGEPFGDSSAIPTYYVSKMARQHVPMVLSGDGGDELFAGYHSYIRWMQLIDNKYPAWKKFAYPFARAFYPERFPARKHSLESWLNTINYFHENQSRKIWRKEYQSIRLNPFEEFDNEYNRADGFSALSKAQYMDIKTYLPYDILVKVDVASMIHSLESRTPLVDYKVAEFAATVPSSIYLNASGNELTNGKIILKKLLGKYFPEEFINRKKMGFGVPVQNWFSSDFLWKNEISERLFSSSSFINEYFNKPYIKTLVDKNDSGKIWLLLVLEEWLKQFYTKK